MDGQDRYPSVILHSFVAKPGAFPRRQDAEEPLVRWIRRTTRLLGGLFVLLGALVLVDLAMPARAGSVRLVIAAGLVLLAFLTFVDQRAIRALAERRRRETESVNRILQVLSRSVSPESIVSTIVEEVRAATRADHGVVARLRPNTRVIEATLVSASPSAPPSTTTLSAALLEAGGEAGGDGFVGIPVAADATPGAAGPVARPSSTFARDDRTAGPGHGRRRIDAAEARLAATRIAEAVSAVYGLKHTLAAPLVTSAGVVGALVLSRRIEEPWPAGSVRILDDAAREAALALERAYAHAAAETAASTDALTGLPNRRYLEQLSALLGAGRRRGDAPGILMIDIDHFKRLNDAYGHQAGDLVLRAVADRLALALRRDDVPVRYGGEEFLVVLRHATVEQAVEVAQRIRLAVRAIDLRRLGIGASVTVSVGVAVAPSRQASIGELVERADAALYEAKRAGRDRVAVAPVERPAAAMTSAGR